MKSKRIQFGIIAVVLALAGVTFAKQQSIHDWLHLRNYTPPTAIAQLATDDGMTSAAKRLFYVNHPVLASGKNFSSQCPVGGEKTVVLGCYKGNDAGIYLYDVTDSRLNGVEQVTAAHETLHAAYRRLSSSERGKIDALLLDYYNKQLKDQRIKDTIAAYKVSEPNDVVNEMHSIFGTEVANLPQPLEQYYARYFKNRATITGYTAKYQGEFTSRQTQVAQYDTQLKSLKNQIDSNETSLNSQRAAIDAQAAKLTSERASGQTATYNNDVVTYNQNVDSYNALLATTKGLITQYNDIVSVRNAVVLEEQQLSKELSANSADI